MSNKKANENNVSVRKDIRIDKELLATIDKVRGDVPFAAWIKRAAIMRLTNEGITVQGDAPQQEIAAKVNKIELRSSVVAGETPLNAKTNRDQIQAIALELKSKGKTLKEIADYFNDLGYLTGFMKPFSRDSVHSLLRYTKNLESNDADR